MASARRVVGHPVHLVEGAEEVPKVGEPVDEPDVEVLVAMVGMSWLQRVEPHEREGGVEGSIKFVVVDAA